MKGLETGKDKIQKICDALKKETLDPAKQEAREIVENAHLQATAVVAEAKKKAEALLQQAKIEMEEKQKVFDSSLQLACRQSIELLKQKIEKELFDGELASLVEKEMKNPKLIVEILQSFMRSMESQGIEDEFVAMIPKEISPRSINTLLGQGILEKLQHATVVPGDFAGGVQIQLKGRKITMDISDATVRDLIAQYIRRDFRDMIFNV